MIKVMIERRTKHVEDLFPLLREIREAAMRSPGYVSGETLGSLKNKSIVVVISTWQTLADWDTWENSGNRAELYDKIQPLLETKPRVKVYKVLATETDRRLANI